VTDHRDFLQIPDFSKDEIVGLFELAERMRGGKYDAKPLAGKTLAMIFMKSSTRTRVSFEVGTYQLGGHALFLSPRDVQLGRGEPIADTARVLSRYVDGIMIRTFAHQDAEELAQYADVPVINGLTDLVHPCQVLADLLTVRQHVKKKLEELTIAWIGDGNNMCNSWINAAYRLGFELRIACPEGYEPADHLLERAKKVAKITVSRSAADAAKGAHVVNTDVWASMGQEGEQQQRERAFRGFTVNAALMEKADKNAIFLHCLPAHRGEEVSADVIDGKWSRVWDEAENRLHIQKAIMAVLMGGERVG
jgi:ornithine carbamoyltransferase